MSVAQRLDLRQSQQLVMTPQLQQAIKMLQMSNLELLDFVAAEMESNPLLEPDPGADASESPAPEAASSAVEGVDRTLSDDRLERATETFDTGAENVFADEAVADRQTEPTPSVNMDGPGAGEAAMEASAWSAVGKGGGRFDDGEAGLEGRFSDDISLREHLLRQLGFCRLDLVEHAVAADLIEQIDDAGYLRADLEETALRLGAPLDAMAAAVARIQTFDPTGVGARNLKECLALQLREHNRLDPVMEQVLDNLDLLAKRDYAKLQKRCKIDAEDLRQIVADIRALNPKPGSRFDQSDCQTVVPDVFVYENRSGGWTIELNADTMPKLLVNATYAAEVIRGAPDDRAQAVKEYLTERQQSAHWLLKSIEQRARTILRVATEIVRQQDGFLAFGVTALRPLNLKRVADAIEMHESTVSRVTSNKFIATPRGVFELKYFFTPAIASTDGEETYSSEAIRHQIRKLIERETADDVLSDDRIVAVLRDTGVDIARRTVAKYRESMNIPSSLQRRKAKQAEAVL